MNPRRRSPWLQQRASLAEDKSVGRMHKPDNWLIILTGLLLAIGLVVVYSISPGLAASQGLSQGYFVTKQLLGVVLAAVAFVVAARLPISWWAKSSNALIAIAIAGSLLVMVTPINLAYPAHRWVRLGSFSFQIAELIKLALIVGLAKFLTDRWRAGSLSDMKSTLKPLIILLLVMGVVVAKLQSDLGSAGVMVVVATAMAFVVGLPLKKVFMVGGLIAVLAVIAVASSGYRRDRLNTYLHPGNDCTDSGYQACQALISVGSGGLVGLGLGYSVQAYGYLPEAANDSIFAIIAEKFGFIGSVITVFIYVVLISRLRQIIERTTDQFSRLIVVGTLAWVSTQMIINIGAMIGLLPLKGITLPLISQGGTSLVFLAAALGLFYKISRYTSYSAVEPVSKGNENAKTTQNTNIGRGVGGTRSTPTFARPRT